MDTIIDEIRFNDVECLAEEGKLGNRIIWRRDGSHSMEDLQIILEFEKLGFQYILDS